MSNFFDHLALINREKLHSQMLAWVFSLPHEIINYPEKEKLLRNFLPINYNEQINNIVATSEYDHIDVAIKFDSGLLLIENKLQSAESFRQTENYLNKILAKNPNTRVFGLFLSLIGDEPQDSRWKCFSYKQLLYLFEKLPFSTSTTNHAIFQEYLNSLRNLTNCFETFIENHTLFPNVFTDGNKKKSEKGPHISWLQDYIRIFQLETVFQRGLLQYIFKFVPIYGSHLSISETHGTALAQLDIASFQCKRSNRKAIVGIQFQGDTTKINLILGDYHKSSITDINKNLQDAFKTHFLGWNGFTKLNRKHKAYLSVSKRIPGFLSTKCFNEIVQRYKDEVSLGINKIRDFIHLQENNNSQ